MSVVGTRLVLHVCVGNETDHPEPITNYYSLIKHQLLLHVYNKHKLFYKHRRTIKIDKNGTPQITTS